MTTSWSYLMKGQWRAAVEANLGGTVLAILAVGLAPWALASACWGRPLGGLPSDRTVIVLASAVVLVTLLDWARRLL